MHGTGTFICKLKKKKGPRMNQGNYNMLISEEEYVFGRV